MSHEQRPSLDTATRRAGDHALAESTRSGVLHLGPGGRVRSWNRAAAALLDRVHLDGVPFPELLTPPYRRFYCLGLEVLREEDGHSLVEGTARVHLQRPDGTRFPAEVVVVPWREDGARYTGILIRDRRSHVRDDEVQARGRRYARLLQRTANMLHQAQDRDTLLQAVVDGARAALEWPVGHVYDHPSEDDPVLRPTHRWSHHEGDGDLWSTIRGATGPLPARDPGSLPGQAVLRNGPAWVADITNLQSDARFQGAEPNILRSGVAFPLGLQRVEAVVELYHPRVPELDSATLGLMEALGTTAGLALDRLACCGNPPEQEGAPMVRVHDTLPP